MKRIIAILIASSFLIAWSTPDSSIKFGTSSAGDRTITAEQGLGATNPKIKFDSSTDSWQFSNDGSTFKNFGSGSGSGLENWIANPDAEDPVLVGIGTYNDSAAAPVDCTGGTASDITAVARNTTPPILNGAADYVLAKGAANAQGQGWTFDITVPGSGHVAAVAGWNAAMRVWAQTSADYDAGDVGVYLCRSGSVTKLTDLGKSDDQAVEYLQSWVTDGNPSSPVTTYKLAFHIQTTNSDAYTIKTDKLYAGIELGSPGLTMAYRGLTPYVPTTQGFGTLGSTQMGYTREGSTANVVGRFLTGTTAASEARISLPDNGTVKSPTASDQIIVGRWWIPTSSATTRKTGPLCAAPGNAYLTFGSDDYTTAAGACDALNGNSVQPSSISSVYVKFDVDLNQWETSVNTAPSPGCEYAATSGTWDAASSTTVYGMQGQPIGGALTAARAKTIAWTRPAKFVRVLVSKDRVSWLPIIGAAVGPSNGTVITLASNAAGAISSGAWLRNSIGLSTDVVFAQYANIANDDSPTADWPSSDAYWVVENCESPGMGISWAMAGENQAGLLNYYKSEPFSTTFTFDGSGGTTSAVDFIVTRIGNVVTLTSISAAPYSATTGTSSANLTSNSALPTWGRPTASFRSHSLSIRNNNNSTNQGASGILQIGINGVLTVLRDQSGTAWTNSANGGVQNAFSVSYAVTP